MKKHSTAWAGATLAAAALVPALACTGAQAQGFMSEAFIPPGEETFTLELGGIVNRFDSSVRVDGQSTQGTPINLENNDLGKDLSTFVASGTWRFLPNHRIDALYYGGKRSGSRTYTGDISIGDQDFPVGATVSLDAKTQIFDVNYRWSFVHTRDLEVATVLGLYGGTFTYDFNAVGSVNGNQHSFNKSVSTTIPLPVIGLSADWYLSDRWKVSLEGAGIKAKIGDVDGHAYVLAASTDYMLWRNVGIGARYGYTDINADLTKSSFKGNLGVKLNGVSAYLKLVF
jgi:hypothetical protein